MTIRKNLSHFKSKTVPVDNILQTLSDSFFIICDNQSVHKAYHDREHEYPIIYGDFFFMEALFKLKGNEYIVAGMEITHQETVHPPGLSPCPGRNGTIRRKVTEEAGTSYRPKSRWSTSKFQNLLKSSYLLRFCHCGNDACGHGYGAFCEGRRFAAPYCGI